MNTAVIMRNSKARTFLYVLLACAMMFTVFLLSSTHTKLKETQESHEKCQQQRDSLSAQLQVVYEHKSRLEKTLQTETLERKKADEALQLSRDEWERDKKGVQSKADQLERKLEEMDKSHQEEFGNLKSSYNSLQQEKEKLEADLARHVVLLQQERDAHLSLNREIAELRDLKLKGDVALDTEVKKMRSQLETCHSEQNLLRAAVQQLKSAPQIPDTEKLQDHAASNLQRAQVVGSAEVGAVLPKSEAKLGRSEQPKGHHDAHPRYQVAPPLRPPQMSAPSAPHWAGGVRQPVPAVVPRSRFEPRDAAVRFDPRNRDHLVQAFMAANGGHRQEEYQLAAPNFGADSGNHNAAVVHHDESAAWHNRL
ncbi:hypothetical protein HPB47_003147 [Ixodes persulcatus]|uniref:Uncharacterized protein n=1 Tax=Ixodes persulcatus TaxID=34615 RepID=A0AC60PJM4_IXOPE|nr:hypothetical protein HPB47_003147 [Ixodes persulcatus]